MMMMMMMTVNLTCLIDGLMQAYRKHAKVLASFTLDRLHNHFVTSMNCWLKMHQRLTEVCESPNHYHQPHHTTLYMSEPDRTSNPELASFKTNAMLVYRGLVKDCHQTPTTMWLVRGCDAS